MKTGFPSRASLPAEVRDKLAAVATPGSGKPQAQRGSDGGGLKAGTERYDPLHPPPDIQGALAKLFRRL